MLNSLIAEFSSSQTFFEKLVLRSVIYYLEALFIVSFNTASAEILRFAIAIIEVVDIRSLQG